MDSGTCLTDQPPVQPSKSTPKADVDVPGSTADDYTNTFSSETSSIKSPPAKSTKTQGTNTSFSKFREGLIHGSNSPPLVVAWVDLGCVMGILGCSQTWRAKFFLPSKLSSQLLILAVKCTESQSVL